MKLVESGGQASPYAHEENWWHWDFAQPLSPGVTCL